MKITTNDLYQIRQGLASRLLSLKITQERKAITKIQHLLDRLDTMEKNFYASQTKSGDLPSKLTNDLNK